VFKCIQIREKRFKVNYVMCNHGQGRPGQVPFWPSHPRHRLEGCQSGQTSRPKKMFTHSSTRFGYFSAAASKIYLLIYHSRPKNAHFA
jgi:hypothetical protein